MSAHLCVVNVRGVDEKLYLQAPPMASLFYFSTLETDETIDQLLTSNETFRMLFSENGESLTRVFTTTSEVTEM